MVPHYQCQTQERLGAGNVCVNTAFFAVYLQASRVNDDYFLLFIHYTDTTNWQEALRQEKQKAGCHTSSCSREESLEVRRYALLIEIHY